MATQKGIIKKTPDRAVRAGALDGHPGHHRGRGRRARLGRRLVRAATTSCSPRRWARSPASTRARSGPWAATPPASSASGSPARATRSSAWASSSPTRTSWCSPRRATASASARRATSGRKHRGGQGVRLIPLEGAKTGNVAAVELVDEDDEELLLISASGQVVRTDVKSVNRYSSAARGVIVMRLNEGDEVAGIAVFRAGLGGAARRSTDNDPSRSPTADATRGATGAPA